MTLQEIWGLSPAELGADHLAQGGAFGIYEMGDKVVGRSGQKILRRAIFIRGRDGDQKIRSDDFRGIVFPVEAQFRICVRQAKHEMTITMYQGPGTGIHVIGLEAKTRMFRHPLDRVEPLGEKQDGNRMGSTQISTCWPRQSTGAHAHGRD